MKEANIIPVQEPIERVCVLQKLELLLKLQRRTTIQRQNNINVFPIFQGRKTFMCPCIVKYCFLYVIFAANVPVVTSVSRPDRMVVIWIIF